MAELLAENLARKLIAEHLIEGEMRPDAEIALKIDQFLLHDGTGPLSITLRMPMTARSIFALVMINCVNT